MSLGWTLTGKGTSGKWTTDAKNQRISESEPPTKCYLIMQEENGRGGWIRTNAWQDQNLLPYRLATPLYLLR